MVTTFLLKKFLSNIYTIIFIILTLFISCRKQNSYNESQNNFITTDTHNKTIIFEAKLVKTNNVYEKYFMFYFKGYPWLKNFCMFESSSTLQQLQTATATIDWQLWDKIYTQNFSPKIEIYININKNDTENWELLSNLFKTNYFPSKQTIFWGSYLYDDIVLNNNYKNYKCSTCHLLPLEQNIFLHGLIPINIKTTKNISENTYYKFKIVFK